MELIFPLQGPNGDVRIVVPVDTPTLWYAYKALAQGGLWEARELIVIAERINDSIARQALPNELFDGVWQRLGSLLNLEMVRGETPITDDLLVLNFCYVLLAHRRITRKEAAKIGMHVLMRKEPQDVDDYDVDNFRKKTDRWAELRGLPKIGQTKRKPRR